MANTSKVAIIGAGPYGLAIAAHCRALGIDYRIFGSPMQSWRMRMPKGMLLKSEPFASNLYEPRGRFTLERFCASHGIPYQPIGLPVSLDLFTAYGLAFQKEVIPDLDERLVVGLEQSSNGFVLNLSDEVNVSARRVIVAVGFAHFSHVPGSLAHLPTELVSHSSDHHDLSAFKGRDITVLGGGASALDLAALLHEHGAAVRLITRGTSLSFLSPERQSMWRWYPRSGLGHGWRNQFYEYGPMLFRRLPAGIRHSIARTALGPAGGFPIKGRVQNLPSLLGHSVLSASVIGDHLHLRLLGPEGDECAISTEHVIAGTGFRVDLRRLKFLSKDIRRRVRSREFNPILSADFESSVPGLHFVGLAAASTFGPSMRFNLGARYTARRLTQYLQTAH